jgi:hypothetical protein
MRTIIECVNGSKMVPTTHVKKQLKKIDNK